MKEKYFFATVQWNFLVIKKTLWTRQWNELAAATTNDIFSSVIFLSISPWMTEYSSRWQMKIYTHTQASDTVHILMVCTL